MAKKSARGRKSKNLSAVKKTSSNSGSSPGGKNSKNLSKNRNSEAMKKIRTFTELVEAMEPTAEELKFRRRKDKENSYSSGRSYIFKCTKCNWNFNVKPEENAKVHVHPCLGVLMCKVCCDYYNDGEFSVDSDGEDKYCRWCGEGGTLFGCSKCICGFCKTCIKKHFGFEYLKEVEEDDDWLCFFCNPKPLWDERYLCSLAVQMSQQNSSEPRNGGKGSNIQSSPKKTTKGSRRKKDPKTSCNQNISESDWSSSSISLEKWRYSIKCQGEKDPKKRLYSSSSDESEIAWPEKYSKKMKFPKSGEKLEGSGQEESFDRLKQVVVEKLERAVKLSEYQMAFGAKWTSKVLNRLADPTYIKTPEDLQKECIKLKCFLSGLAAHLLEFCSSIDSAEKNIQIEDGIKDSNNLLQPPTDPMGFAGIIKFLSFVTNQVNLFVKKGFSLSEVLEAEILQENNFIGLKKISKSYSADSFNESACSVSSRTTETSFNEKNKGSNPKTREKVDETGSSDEDPLKIVAEEDSKAGEHQEESHYESEDMNSTPPEMKETKNDIRQIMQILENS